MRQKGFSAIIVILLVIIIGLLGFLVYQSLNPTIPPTPTPTPIASASPSPTPIASATPTGNPIWNVYENQQYGFQISYPDNYQALDSQNDLYGWPYAVVLLYNGGQAYDIVIEAWDSMAQYDQNHPSNETFDSEVEQIGDKYISVTDYTGEPENAAVTATFQEL